MAQILVALHTLALQQVLAMKERAILSLPIITMASSKALLAVALCALLAVASAHDFSSPHTLELTASSYEEQVRYLAG